MSARNDSGSPQIVPVTDELVTAFWGAPRYNTMRGLAAVKDGHPICIAGIYFDGDKMCAFADIREEMRKFRKTGVRMGHELAAMMTALGTDVYALADKACPNADLFLIHLGFERALPETNPELFVWRT